MEGYSEFALSDEEKARGLILACRAVPWEDCEVAWLEEDDLIVHPRRILACKVVGLDDATHDIKRVRLGDRIGRPVRLLGRPVRLGDLRRLPAARLLDGQRAGRSDRSSSMSAASVGGATSAYVAERLKLGDSVRVEGPFGASYLRESHRGPIIAVAGGSGLAPIKSIVERALAQALPQHIHLYFGVRTERDLYLARPFRRAGADSTTTSISRRC